MANLGIPIFRRSAWATNEPAHSRFETDERKPLTWAGSNLYVHPMLGDPNDAAANPFDFGDNVSKAVRVNVVAGAGAGGGTSSNFGAAFPASGTAAGAKDNVGNMAALNLDALGQLMVVLPAGGGGLTNAELRAVAVPVSVAALPLPAGAATEATLAGVLTTAAFQARINTLGQKAMAASTPVVLASDQSAIPITVAALPLPAGAATEATLATRLADATFTARINTQGQKAMAASTPVVIASDQSALPITVAALPLPAGAATEATLAAMSAKLPAALVGGRLDTNIGAWLGSVAPTVGQKAMASSIPVVIASDQSNITVIGSGNFFVSPTSQLATAYFVNRLSDGTAFYDAAKTGQFPAALVGGRLDVNVGAWLGSAAPTVGQKVMGSSVPVVIASDQSAVPVVGDVDHDAVNTAKVVQVGGHASPAQTAPAAVSAAGDRARIWIGMRGEQIIRHREIPTYLAVYRLAARPYALSNVFAAAGRKQYASLYHLNTSTKILRLLRCWAALRTFSAAAIASLELVMLTSAVTPATGNPIITPQPLRSAGGAAEAVALALPTTAGTEAVNSILAYREAQASAASALGTATNIPAGGGFVTSGTNPFPTDGMMGLPPLYQVSPDIDAETPTVANGVAGGFGLMVDANAAVTLTGFVVFEFNEETP